MKGCRPLTSQEIPLVLAAFCDGSRYACRNRALFLLGLLAGFRISELLSLRVRDIVQNGTVVERVRVQRRNMKKKIESRTVILHPEAREALVEWIRELQAAGYAEPELFLFRSSRGFNQPISRQRVWKIFDQVFRRLGLTGQLGTHCMRKTFADAMYRRLGENIFKVKEALGQKSVESTVSYLSFVQREIDEAVLGVRAA